MHGTSLSVVITAYNEGADLARTVDDVIQSSVMTPEVFIADDGSVDGCCEILQGYSLRMLRHEKRIGVAASRNEVIESCSGIAVAILDGHHRLEFNCLNRCAVLAVDSQAIVCPDLLGFEDPRDSATHGAYFRLELDKPPFHAFWRNRVPLSQVTRVSSLRAPPYVFPKQLYPKIRWSPLLRGWGGSEACLSLKAFFTDTPILHLCGPIAYHKFKKKFHYEVTWDEVWRNHALIARICFSETTWRDYWLPEVFQDHLNEETRREMDSDAVIAEHLEFQQLKVRPDHEFWTRLVFQKVPAAVQR